MTAPLASVPAQIAALPSFRGIPVSHTVRWSSESDVTVRGNAIWTFGQQGDGTPLLGSTNPQRVRECTLDQRCQVCAGPSRDVLLCDLRIGWQTLRVDGREVPLVVDSWTCRSCLRYSLIECPALVRRRPVTIFDVRRWVPVPTPERPNWITASMLPYGPIGYVKIAVVEADEVSEADL